MSLTGDYNNAMKDKTNYWTPDQVNAILHTTKEINYEHYLLFKWLWLSGRRLGEIIGTQKNRAKKYAKKHPEKIISGVRVRDVLWFHEFGNKNVVYNIEKKRTPRQTVLMLPETFLAEIIQFVKNKGLKPEDKIFDTYAVKTERILKKVLNKATYVNSEGVILPVKKGTIHTFRHSFATYAINILPLPTVSHHLQHSTVQTTMTYFHPSDDYGDKLYAGMV